MPIWGWVCIGLTAAAVAFVAFALWQFGRQQERLTRDGRTVVARVLFAHPCLYDAADRSTFSAAFVVFTLDDDNSPAHLAYLAGVCERLEGFRPGRNADADEQKIGRALSQQITVGQTPLRLPNRVTGGREVYFATPNVMRRMLPEGMLTEEYIYLKVLIDGDYRDLAMIDYPTDSGSRS
jgi:hypothetical protein